MSRWVCPKCDREFGRMRQSHVCVPGCTLEETFAGRPEVQREIYDRIAEFLETLGPVHFDSVSVGVFIKRETRFADVRPMARALSVSVVLPRRLESPRVVRTYDMSEGRIYHVLRLTDVDQVNDELLDWLAEAYDADR